MRNLTPKPVVGVAGLLISILSLFPFILLVSAANIMLLQIPQMQGPGTGQVIKILLAGPTLLLLLIAWLGLVLFAFDSFSKGIKEGTFLRRFALLTSFVLYLFPLVILLYHFLFPDPMTGIGIVFPVPWMRVDWIMAGAGLLLGSVFLYVHRSLSRR